MFLTNGDEEIYIFKNPEDCNKVELEIPEYQVFTPVFVKNKEHKFYLEMGVVVDTDHKHVRVKFYSYNPDIHNKCLWMPDHWIQLLPKELLKRSQ
jgi:hypothetical protein